MSKSNYKRMYFHERNKTPIILWISPVYLIWISDSNKFTFVTVFFSIQADQKCYNNPSSSISRLLFTRNSESRTSEATAIKDSFRGTNVARFFLSLIVIN